MRSHQRSAAGQANDALGAGNANVQHDVVARANGPTATQGTSSAPRPPTAAIVIRPAGTFNNAREVLDWLGVRHQPPEAQRYDCFAGGLPVGIPVRPPAAGHGVQPHQGGHYIRRQSYAFAGHPTRTAVPTAEGQGASPDHKRVGRAPPVAAVTRKPDAQENAAPGPSNVPGGKDKAHGGPASTVPPERWQLPWHTE
ncbi:hypothetical protein MRX96_058699 [Rhipicephalus microplus]